MVADGATQHGVAGLECVEYRTLRHRADYVDAHLAAGAGERSQMRWKNDPDHKIPITPGSGPRPKAQPEDRGRWEPMYRLHRTTRIPVRRWCRNTRRIRRACPPPLRRAAHSRSSLFAADLWLAAP